LDEVKVDQNGKKQAEESFDLEQMREMLNSTLGGKSLDDVLLAKMEENTGNGFFSALRAKIPMKYTPFGVILSGVLAMFRRIIKAGLPCDSTSFSSSSSSSFSSSSSSSSSSIHPTPSPPPQRLSLLPPPPPHPLPPYATPAASTVKLTLLLGSEIFRIFCHFRDIPKVKYTSEELDMIDVIRDPIDSSQVRALFDKFDLDHDGKLSEEEWNAFGRLLFRADIDMVIEEVRAQV